MSIMVRSDETGKYPEFVMSIDNKNICSINKEDFRHEIKKYGDYETFFSYGGKFNEIVHENRQAELLELFKDRLLCNKVKYLVNEENILEKARRSLHQVGFSTNTTKKKNEDTLLIQLFKYCLSIKPSLVSKPSSPRGKNPKDLPEDKSADFKPSSPRGMRKPADLPEDKSDDLPDDLPEDKSDDLPEDEPDETWMGTIKRCIGNRCSWNRCSRNKNKPNNKLDFKAKRSKRKTTSAKKSVKKPVKKALQKTPKKPIKKTPKKASKTSHARRV